MSKTINKEIDSFSIENIDFVICQVCGNRFKQVHNLHLRTHNLTINEYKMLYPDAILTCRLTRTKISQSMQGEYNHNFNIKFSSKTRARIGRSRKGVKNPMFGKIPSPEHRAKISQSRKEGVKSGRIIPLSGKDHPQYGLTGEKSFNFGRKHTNETKAKLSQVNSGENAPNFGKKLSEETKNKMRFAHIGKESFMKGKKFSPEICAKMSQSAKKSYLEGRRHPPKNAGRGNAYHRPDLNHWFRSNWEANYARILNFQEILWEYESHRFDLGDYTYLPDFYLPKKDCWIEVKGYIKTKDKERVDYQLRVFSKGHDLTVIDEKTYKQLEKQYKSLIPYWETKGDERLVKTDKEFKFIKYEIR